MNSLEYLRNLCNISQSFLAELIGVSRQSIYLWENERKELPAKRRKQLSELFGLEERFFGEINEDIVKEIYQKQAYLHALNGKSYYCFVVHENAVYGKNSGTYLHTPNDAPLPIQSPISFNDKLDIYKKHIQNLLESIQELSQEYDDDLSVHSRISCRYRVEHAFTGLVCSVQQISTKRPEQKMIYWRTLWDAIAAISLAYGSIEEDDFEKENDDLANTPYCASASWIIELAQIIKQRNDNGCEIVKRY